MTTYHDGDTILGALDTINLTPAPGVTSATITLAGLFATFDITAPTNGNLTIDNTVAVGSNIGITTDGAAVTLGSSVLSANALGDVNTTINGGSFTLGTSLITGNVLSGGSITFNGSGTSIVGTSGSFITLDLLDTLRPYNGFTSNSDVIDDRSLAFTGSTSYTISGSPSDQQVTITQGGQDFTFALNDAGSGGTGLTDGTYNTLTGGPLHISADGSGGTDITLCFSSGTRIETLEGEVAVERLEIGTLVSTQKHGRVFFRPVKWVGHRQINLAAHPRPHTVAPICIQRGAFAENIPYRDLMVSPDHAIFVNCKLICARQLVNGTTIRQVAGLPSVEYFHVELHEHDILIAEGLPTESYLDTGNRGFFANSGEPLVLHPDLACERKDLAREAASCVPFVWDEENVRPVWETLAERAASLGHPVSVAESTADPELCIAVGGRTSRPIYAVNGSHHFVVPKGETEVHLVSRSASPTDTRPWMEDHRRLGVYVERVRLRCGSDMQEIPVDHPGLLQGWWAVERNGVALRRWTNGNARLQLPIMNGPAILEIQATNSGMRYLMNADKHYQAA